MNGPAGAPPTRATAGEPRVSVRGRRGGGGVQCGSLVFGAGRDLERAIRTHLFVICPNNSGSTFLKEVLATSRATWNLHREGQKMLGYAGPVPGSDVALIWASTPALRDSLTDARSYDWARTCRAWYFQAFAQDPRASVFVTKSPPHLLLVEDLARHFANPKFVFMVRDPYAVCEGICRYMRGRLPPSDLPERAARHVVACLAQQRRNVEAHRSDGVFFTYEAMCREPGVAGRRIAALAPELDDLELRRRVAVKGHYHEMLTDMNERQIARLQPRQVAAFNRVFRAHPDVLEYFGYELLAERRPGAPGIGPTAAASGGYVVLTTVNRRFLGMFDLWFRYYAATGIRWPVHVLATDARARAAMGVRVSRGQPLVVHAPETRHAAVTVRRLDVLKALLDRGFDVVSTDLDAFWLSERTSGLPDRRFDVQLSVAAYGWPPEAIEAWGFSLCCGFSIIHSNPSTRMLLDQWIARCVVDDQKALNHLLVDHGVSWSGRGASGGNRGACDALGLTLEAIDDRFVTRGPDLGRLDRGRLAVFHPRLSGRTGEAKVLQSTLRLLRLRPRAFLGRTAAAAVLAALRRSTRSTISAVVGRARAMRRIARGES